MQFLKEPVNNFWFTVFGVLFFLMFLVVGVSLLFARFVVKEANGQKANVLATKRVIDFRIDSSFSTQEVFQIQSVLKEWEIATNGHVKLSSFVDDVSMSEIFDWKEDDYSTIYNAKFRLGWKRLAGGGSKLEVIGVAFIPSGDIFIFDDQLFKTIVRHEVGHVLLGTWHSDREEELMYPTISNPKNIGEREALFVQLFAR